MTKLQDDLFPIAQLWHHQHPSLGERIFFVAYF